MAGMKEKEASIEMTRQEFNKNDTNNKVYRYRRMYGEDLMLP